MVPEEEGTFQELTQLLWLERLESKSASKEARLIKALDESAAGAEKVSTAEVTKFYNDGLGPKEQLSPESVGRRLRALGFARGRGAGGPRAVLVDYQLLSTLKTRWGLEFPKEEPVSPEEPSLPSQPSLQPRLQTQEHGDSYLPRQQDAWDEFLKEIENGSH